MGLRRGFWLLLLGALGLLAGVEALLANTEVTDLRVSRQEVWLCIDMQARELLDEHTALTVDSGLPGTCLYHIRLEDDQHTVAAEHYVEQSLRLDLWENRYILEGPNGRREFATLAAADSAWSRLEHHSICLLEQLQADRRYRVVIQIVVQPLATADRERLSRYVSRHSGSNSEELALDLGALFSRVLGGKGGGDQVLRHDGPFFAIRELEEGP